MHEQDEEIERLQRVADWMRANGVVGLRIEGCELRLDPSWTPPSDTIPAPEPDPENHEDKAKELARLHAEVKRRPFRHVRMTRTESRHAKQ